MTAAPRTSLATFQHAHALLQAESGHYVREHPFAALLGILVHRAELPQFPADVPITSPNFVTAIERTYRKAPPFDGDVGPGAELKRAGFGPVAAPGPNDWRNAVAAQKGLGCFGSDVELASLAFRTLDRPQCEHRNQGADGDRCDLAPNGPDGPTRCRSVSQAAGEVPKLIQITTAAGTHNRYRAITPDAADLAKLRRGNDRIPLGPFLPVFYGGSTLRPEHPVITSTMFYDDLGLTPAAAAELFDDDPATPANQEIAHMSEPFLLVSLRRRLFDLGFSISLSDLINFYLSLKPRAFVILSGISGTGKSQLPRRFAELVLAPDHEDLANFEAVPVRPGWNDVADLTGYYNSIHEGFEPGPVLEAFRKATDASDGHGPTATILLLDELNLSRIEHYFADFLSIMETRRLHDGEWITDPLRLAGGRTGTLNFVGTLDDDDPVPFVNSVDAELRIPDNLFVVGTVNIDESTQGISNKVLDRANTIEFETVDFAPTAPPAPDGYEDADLHLLGHALAERPYRTIADAAQAHPELVADMTARLTQLNAVLKDWRLHFGMRSRDEICTYLAYAQDLLTLAQAANVDLDGFSLDAAFDRQVLQKVLPRITGTREELKLGPAGDLFDRLKALLTGWQAGASVAKLDRMANQELVNFWEA